MVYSLTGNRIRVKGKFLMLNNEKFFIKGVTYGTFAPIDEEVYFPDAETIEKDFAAMCLHGINAVRTYTVPPMSLLDTAARYQLKVMVGLPWEQHINFLDDRRGRRNIIRSVQEGVQKCRQHPAILCYVIGNEIPASQVRWYGRHRIEKFLHRLYKTVKAEDPQGLCTYVNYPTTEYLQLPFLDFTCFNVYLETPQKLESYLARLHNLCEDRPLVLAEIGLDSRRNGLQEQARVLAWQVRTAFARGVAGTFIFAWTDEWWRGGFEIEDWDFGLVDRARQAKPALESLATAYREVPFGAMPSLPKISVVVCSYNGATTIEDTLEGLAKLSYPDYEVIIINDGSTDCTEEIVKQYPAYHLISTSNRGLSNARNTGWQAASGEIIAYLDDDAYPDPHWLHYLAYAYQQSEHAAIGGPNLAPGNDGPIAECVSNAPGGPVHVLLTDEIAEHIPGCNMSFRRSVLAEIGGFDPIYRAAGDDVDICWRVQQAGYTIGYHPAAMVWHHCRNSLRMYWKQQLGYGKAEALLESKWPSKYNGLGHYSWAGRIYGNGLTQSLATKKGKIFYGTWGTALFQSVYQPAPSFLASIPLMPEWYFLIALLGFLAVLGFSWAPLLWAWPLLLLAISLVVLQAAKSAGEVRFSQQPDTRRAKVYFWGLTTLLHMIQPIARLLGRLRHGLTPWRHHNYGMAAIRSLLIQKEQQHWSETWRSSDAWLRQLESLLIDAGNRVKRGGKFDRWDLQVHSGIFSKARCLLTVEEHGGGKQYLRLRTFPVYSRTGLLLMAGLAALVCAAFNQGALLAGSLLLPLLLAIAHKYAQDTAAAYYCLQQAFSQLDTTPEEPPEEEEPIISRQEEMPEVLISEPSSILSFARLMPLTQRRARKFFDDLYN